MTLLPGQPLSAVSARLAESDLFGVYRQMGSSLAALHRIAQPAFGYLTTAILDPKPTNTDYMTWQFAKKLREFSDLGGDSALRDALELWDWFASIGQTQPLDSLARDMGELTTPI
jgi:hygromycin-B 7''-O-kinase